MGIEPTCETVYAPHNGFEDRDRHQVGTYFLGLLCFYHTMKRNQFEAVVVQ